MGPALLLAHEVDHEYRTAAVKADWARSRPVVRQPATAVPPRRALGGLPGRALRLLHG